MRCCILQIQLRNRVDRADYTPSTRQHELDHTDHTDHTDQESICPGSSYSSSTVVGIDHTDHTDHLADMCDAFFLVSPEGVHFQFGAVPVVFARHGL